MKHGIYSQIFHRYYIFVRAQNHSVEVLQRGKWGLYIELKVAL